MASSSTRRSGWVALDSALPGTLNLLFHGVFLAVALAGIVTRSERYHAAVAYASVIFMATYILLLFGELQ